MIFKFTVVYRRLPSFIVVSIDNSDANAPIPLLDVNGEILAKVIKYTTWHHAHPTPASDEKCIDYISPWDLEFCDVDQYTLFKLILVCSYV